MGELTNLGAGASLFSSSSANFGSFSAEDIWSSIGIYFVEACLEEAGLDWTRREQGWAIQQRRFDGRPCTAQRCRACPPTNMPEEPNPHSTTTILEDTRLERVAAAEKPGRLEDRRALRAAEPPL